MAFCKKLFADGARDNHTRVGPTPSPLSRRLPAKRSRDLELRRAFWPVGHVGHGKHICWLAVRHQVNVYLPGRHMRTSLGQSADRRNIIKASQQIVLQIADWPKLTLKCAAHFVILLFRTNRKQIGKISLRVAVQPKCVDAL